MYGARGFSASESTQKPHQFRHFPANQQKNNKCREPPRRHTKALSPSFHIRIVFDGERRNIFIGFGLTDDNDGDDRKSSVF